MKWTERAQHIGDGIGRSAVSLAAWTRRRPKWAAAAAVVLLLAGGGVVRLLRSPVDEALIVRVRRGPLQVRLVETGVLRPAQSITYAAPLPGRELEITFLVPEGTRVQEGDLLVRLDSTELESERMRARQELRQAEMDLQSAGLERQEAASGLQAFQGGSGSIGLDEAQATLRVAERKLARLKAEHDGLRPLFEKGYITREELDRTGFELEQAEAEVQLARKKTAIYSDRTYPQDRERARMLYAQKEAQHANVQVRIEEAGRRVTELAAAVEGCALYAQRPGLVVYEELLVSNPRRKVRVGDRVTRSQGLITIPEVNRMVVESSVDEASVHKLRPGQRATVRLDAYPDLELAGKVGRVGTLARSMVDRPFGEKRFDLVIEIEANAADLRPEMSARVDVLTGERPDTLLIPVNAVFERDGVLIAGVVGFWGIRPRPIDLGETGEHFVEVLAGLREGERLALVEPPNVGPARGPVGPRQGPAVGEFHGDRPSGGR